MIKMGKSSKTNEDDRSPTMTDTTQDNSLSVSADTQTSSAVSESEMMARDIKEGRLSGFVGGGTVLTGETHFDAMLRIDGHLKGSVSSDDGILIIGSTGQVDADVTVASAIVNGAVNGDVTTTEKLTLGRTARVVGNIQAPRLIIEDGAVLEGGCSMIKSQEELETRIAESQQQFTTPTTETYETVEETEEEVEETEDSPTYETDTSTDVDESDEDSEENAEAATY